MPIRKRTVVLAILAALAMLGAVYSANAATATVFSVSFPKTRSDKPLDGRILLILSTDPSAEPRMQINDTPKTQIIFGVDVDNMLPGQAASWARPRTDIPSRVFATFLPANTMCRPSCIATKLSIAPMVTR
jgi:hypothetical protein